MSVQSKGQVSGHRSRGNVARLIVGPAALALGVFGAATALASPASAAVPAVGPGYGPSTICTITINVTITNDGATVVVSGNCGGEGDTLTFTLHSTPVTLGSVTAGPGGTYNTALTMPSDTPLGEHTITVTDQATGANASVGVDVVAAGTSSNGGSGGVIGTSGSSGSGSSGSGSGSIAFTGTDALATTAVGAGAIGLGGMLVLSSKKRRRNSFSS